MNLTLDLNSIFQACTLALILTSGKWLSTKFKTLDELVLTVNSIKKDVEKKIDHEDVIILRRDLDTCFRRLDLLKKHVGLPEDWRGE